MFDFEYGRTAATVGTKSSVLDASISKDDSKSGDASNNATETERTRATAETLALVRLQEYQQRLLATEDDYV